MKKLSLLLLTLIVCLFTACHKDIWAELENLDQRVTKLEELCKEMNTNITSLQTIVDVLQSNDFITSIVEIKKDGKVVGYTITFGKHDPITIYHGQDGKDGADGKDGQDGQNGSASAPVIGVAQDIDGVYYWTLNGEWLLDDNGNKLPVSGKDGQNGADGKDGQDGTDGKNGQDGTDGKDGQDGEDGKDGADGQDGKDGITPQLKIEEGYWYISYDNGATWTQLGKATGEDGQDGKDGADGADGKDGQNGADGKDGQDGDSMFQSVTQDENYVYFTLADGTVIKIAKASEEHQPNSEFMFIVTYDANGGEGTMKPDTFYYGIPKVLNNINYVKQDYYFIGWNTKADGLGVSYKNKQELLISKNITLYAQWGELLPGTENGYQWIDLGLSVKWATCNVGATSIDDWGSHFAWGEVQPKNYYHWITYKWCDGTSDKFSKYCTDTIYGEVDNKTILDIEDDAANANWGGNWRMPTIEEWKELLEKCNWEWSLQNKRYGYLVTSQINGKCIFLPAGGWYFRDGISNLGSDGFYWSANLDSTMTPMACGIIFASYVRNIDKTDRNIGWVIRPVCP